MAERVPRPDPSILGVLEERARQLARPPDEGTPGETIEVVVLRVGEDRYAVESARVREVLSIPDPTLVPGTPPAWSGLVNIRGALFPVIGLRLLLADTPGGAEEQTRVVLVDAARGVVGLATDGVPEIRRIRLEDIRPPFVESSGGRVTPVTGITPDLVAMLDLDVLMADPRLEVGNGRAREPREGG